MNIPMSWIAEYADIGKVDLNDYMHRLTMIGQKVEGAELVGERIDKIVVGKILTKEKHPNADKLWITTVDVGTGKPLQIVTAAQNIFEGALIPVALSGAVLADGTQIHDGELRGVPSQGMMCSVEELGFTNHDFPEAPEDGIYIISDASAALGSDICALLDIRQEVVEYEITSNRPDCFSVVGIAREAAAAYGAELKMPETKPAEAAGGNAADMIQIEIKNPTLCPRYAARLVKNAKIEPSPQWMRRRLTSAGVRPINNIVDITNYVMLELGQPMHAFDLSEVAGGIVVKNAADGEKFTTLDGVERTLDSSMLVIADHEKSLAVAGVMGGENSKITGGAGAILFESANFDGTNIRVTAKKLGMRTDASSKYEKGIDPNLVELAVDRAAFLVELLGAGEVVRGIADCYPNKREAWTIDFDWERINKIIGIQLSQEEMVRLIRPFDIVIENGKAIIPTNRPDLEGIADLAEEVARAYGYDKIEPKMLEGAPTVGRKTTEQELLDKIKATMISCGFYEALTYSFESPKVFDKLRVPQESPLRKTIDILNPLGESYSVMRTTAVNSMLESLATNYKKRNPAASLFEAANIYLADSVPIQELPEERQVLIGGMYGGETDFYAAKGCIETLLDTLAIRRREFRPKSDIAWLHPGRSAEVSVGGQAIGFVGEAHPAVLEQYGIGKKAYLFELELAPLISNASVVHVFQELPKYPAVQRDIALVVSDAVLVLDMEESIRENGGELLTSIELFDIYKSEQLGDGLKSVAFALSFRSPERTLSDAEVSPLMDAIVRGLEKDTGAKLRS